MANFPKSLAILLLAVLVVTQALPAPDSKNDRSQKWHEWSESSESSDSESSETEETGGSTDPFKQKIGILGGGPSGLFAARELVRKGYQRVKVLERSDAGVANITNTLDIDGQVYDTTTRFIPGNSFDGPGIPANFKEMIDDYGLALTPSGFLSYLDTSTPSILPGPHFFSAFPGEQIVGDLVFGFELLKTVRTLGSVTACHAAGIASPDETWATFSQRINKPVFSYLAAYVQDLFLGGRGAFQPACVVLQVRSRFLASDIAAVLKQAGITSAVPGIGPELGSLLDLSFLELSRLLFVDGYQNFFDTLVSQENINVKLGEEVLEVKKKNNGRFKVTTSKKSRNFDKIIIATRPWDATPFLPVDAPVRVQYEKVFFDPVYVLASRVQGSVPLLPSTYAAVLYPQAFTAGTAYLPYNGVPLAFSKFHSNQDVIVSIGFTNAQQTEAEIQAINIAKLAEQGVTVTEVVSSAVYPYVADVNINDSADGFFEIIDSLQGVDGYYFVSEAMAGAGVPSILDYSQQIVNRFF